MKTVTMLQAEWLEAPFTKEVVTALGAENVKFVGGAVRDTVLSRDVADIDAATRHEPEQTMRLLEGAGIKVIPTGLKHGTVTAVSAKQTMEITTLRVDVETDGRHAEVAYTQDWLEDAGRRDFTFNALYVSPDGELFDPYGGVKDLQAGKVRFIGDAEKRIEEDALRILRFFRFFGRYGKGDPDAEALAACAAKKTMLAKLSVERVRDEFLKIMALPNLMHVISPMWKSGLIHEAFGPDFRGSDIELFIQDEKRCGASIDPLLRFRALAFSAFKAYALSVKFKLSNSERQFLCNLEKAQSEDRFCDGYGIRRFIYHYGVRITLAVAIGGDKKLYDETTEICKSWSVPVMPVKGQDLLDLGNEPGPGLGKTLKKIEARWVASDFSLSKQDLLELA